MSRVWVAVLFLAGTIANAQSGCENIVRYAAYDFANEVTGYSSDSLASHQFCSEYASLKKSNNNIDAGASYGIFNASVNVSGSQLEALNTALCSADFSSQQIGQMRNALSQTVDPNAMAAYDECIKAEFYGLHWDYTLSDQRDLITMQFNYVTPPGTGQPANIKITGIQADPADKVKCSGDAFDYLKSGKAIGANSVTVNCTRMLENQPFDYSGRKAYAKAARVVVSTTNKTLPLYLPARFYTPEPPNDLVPVGTIQSYAGSVLPPGWAWCDGTAVPRTGKYSQLFSVVGEMYGRGDGSSTFALPDLRGKFVRGLDRDGSMNDKDRVNGHQGLGTPQDDSLASHSHAAKRTKAGEICGGCPQFEHMDVMVDNASADPNSATWTRISGMTTTAAAGGTETRPKNVAVNFIVKY